MKKAQLSVEMVLVLSLFLLVISWAVGYVNAADANSRSASLGISTAAIAQTAANLANSACSTQTAISFQLPCASMPRDYATSSTQLSFYAYSVKAAAGDAVGTASTVCPVSGTASIACSPANTAWACIDGNSQPESVKLYQGKCA